MSKLKNSWKDVREVRALEETKGEELEMERKRVRKLIRRICLVAFLVMAAGLAFIQIQQPYAITVDNQSIVFVENKGEAKGVIKRLMKDYAAENSKIKSISIDKDMGIEQKKIWEGIDRSEIVSKDEAVKQIKSSNDGEKNLLVATIVGKTVTEEEYTPEINYVKDENMFVGEREVEGETTTGKQKVTREITTVNGEITEAKVIDKEITEKASVQTVRVGVKGLPEGEDWKTYQGDPRFAKGEDLVEYGKKFLGNPYVKGGTSLTNGCDCVGFVRAMYKYYGVSLPSTLGKVGKRVSVSDIKPGDIVCYYRHHVALYLGDGKIIHAANPKKDICIGNLGGGIKQVRRVIY